MGGQCRGVEMRRQPDRGSEAVWEPAEAVGEAQSRRAPDRRGEVGRPGPAGGGGGARRAGEVGHSHQGVASGVGISRRLGGGVCWFAEVAGKFGKVPAPGPQVGGGSLCKHLPCADC